MPPAKMVWSLTPNQKFQPLKGNDGRAAAGQLVEVDTFVAFQPLKGNDGRAASPAAIWLSGHTTVSTPQRK